MLKKARCDVKCRGVTKSFSSPQSLLLPHLSVTFFLVEPDSVFGPIICNTTETSSLFTLTLNKLFLACGCARQDMVKSFCPSQPGIPRLKHYFPTTLFFWEVFQWLGQIRQGRSGAGRCQSMQPAANFYHLCHLFYYTFFISHSFSLWVHILVTH